MRKKYRVINGRRWLVGIIPALLPSQLPVGEPKGRILDGGLMLRDKMLERLESYIPDMDEETRIARAERAADDTVFFLRYRFRKDTKTLLSILGQRDQLSLWPLFGTWPSYHHPEEVALWLYNIYVYRNWAPLFCRLGKQQYSVNIADLQPAVSLWDFKDKEIALFAIAAVHSMYRKLHPDWTHRRFSPPPYWKKPWEFKS